ncbi:hypothetical protein QBC38DRAFT_549646 [Podospora fimiseda]|uniref:Carrier domain-containing protein n=1 Tax=Podospora fimiseda TaxID=252190 RepID=A0AAN6YMN5_9PEZI|nr:hypothetical protein QBC38DRAFT_549646 [Podospora fimiseda]
MKDLKSFLAPVESCVFPTSYNSNSRSNASDNPQLASLPLPRHLSLIAQERRESAETLVQLAWALVLRSYLCTNSACYGYHIPSDVGGEQIDIASRELNIICAVLDPASTLSSSLRKWQKQVISHNVAGNDWPTVGKGIEFNTALILGDGVLRDGLPQFSATAELPILAFVDISPFGAGLSVIGHSSSIAPQKQVLLTHAFHSAIVTLLLQPKQKIANTHIFTVWDDQLVATWNQSPLTAVDSTVHDLFRETLRSAPDAPSIASWDGNLTYGELDNLSSLLARKLQAEAHIGPESVVALRFFKSTWAVVSMLAVLKAGGVFVSLDPNHPPQRQSQIISSSGARLVLTGEDLIDSSPSSHLKSVVVSAETLSQEDSLSPSHQSQPAQPTNAAYIVYTSGSTGTPKGIVVSHSALSTSVLEQAKSMDITPSSRVLQYAAYTFDVSVGDIFTTLVAGACLCIPDESTRRDDLAKAMTDLGVTHACLTSTVAGTIDPQRAPTLRVLTFGGEALSKHAISQWSKSNVTLHNIYGPAECTVWCFVQRNLEDGQSGAKIGFGLQSKGWIVHPEDSDKLMPVGAIGELLVEGPLLAKGYLDDKAKTDASFIVDPAWRAIFGPEEGCKLYKTGDLVRYDVNDGGFVFVGRKDTQVKLRGQRIELGEIEHHLGASVGISEVVVDLVKPSGVSDPTLAAFITVGQGGLDVDLGHNTDIPDEVRERVVSIAQTAKDGLAKHLPVYMHPSLFIPLQKIPLSVSGKTDRKRLRAMCADLPWADLKGLSSFTATAANGSPSSAGTEKTAAEAELAENWSQLLGLPASDIKTSDNFIALGGDSLKAIQLVAALRGQGKSLGVASLLRSPQLSDMVGQIVLGESDASGKGSKATGAELSNLLKGELLEEACTQCGVQPGAVADIYPCTPLQAEMMESSLRGETTQFAHELIKLWPSVDVERFKAVWADLVQLNPILRTRFIRDHKTGFLRQVVLNEDLLWESPKNFATHMETHFSEPLKLGARLGRWAMYRDPDTDEQMVAIDLHHSLFDGITLVHVFTQLAMAYYGAPPPETLPEFGTFLGRLEDKRVSEGEEEERFWRRHLSGLDQAAVFPRVPDDYQPHASGSAMRFFETGSLDLGNLTLSTLVRGAWSLLLSRKTSCEDVVFGAFLAGRNVDVPGIESLVAPTFVHVPILARISPTTQTTRQFLDKLQADAISMIPFEHTGMLRIGQILSKSPNPRSLLVVQPMPGGGVTPPNMPGESGPFPGEICAGPRVEAAAMGAFNWYPLLVECTLLGAAIVARVSFDESVISAVEVDAMLVELESIIKEMGSRLDAPLVK